jgi:hypothetical protein
MGVVAKVITPEDTSKILKSEGSALSTDANLNFTEFLKSMYADELIMGSLYDRMKAVSGSELSYGRSGISNVKNLLPHAAKFLDNAGLRGIEAFSASEKRRLLMIMYLTANKMPDRECGVVYSDKSSVFSDPQLMAIYLNVLNTDERQELLQLSLVAVRYGLKDKTNNVKYSQSKINKAYDVVTNKFTSAIDLFPNFDMDNQCHNTRVLLWSMLAIPKQDGDIVIDELLRGKFMSNYQK